MCNILVCWQLIRENINTTSNKQKVQDLKLCTRVQVTPVHWIFDQALFLPGILALSDTKQRGNANCCKYQLVGVQ